MRSNFVVTLDTLS